MSRDLTPADTGRAAALIGAVLSGDADGVARVLTPLAREDLYAVAIVLAANVSEDTVLRTAIDDDGADAAEALCRAIVHATAARWKVSVADVLSTSRKRDSVMDARHVAMAAARHAGVSGPAIGRFFGRDHSTVASAVSRVGESRKLRTAAASIGWDAIGGRPADEMADPRPQLKAVSA